MATATITFGDLRRATLAARERTGDKAIGVAVKQGRFQIQRITYPPHLKGRSDVQALSEYLPADRAIDFLGELTV